MNEIANSTASGAFADRESVALERRLFRIMIVGVALAVTLSAVFAPWRVTTGLLLGGILAFFNHHWLRGALQSVFGGPTSGKRSQLSGARYVLRYFIIASVVASAYMFDLISIVATIGGLCAFAAAVMIEAFIQLYFAIVHREEN